MKDVSAKYMHYKKSFGSAQLYKKKVLKMFSTIK